MPLMRGGIVAENSAVCPALRGVAEDRLDVLGEAHVKHLVRFVKDDDPEAAQVQRSAADVVERPPGRRHHHVDTAVKRPQLPANRLAAVDGHHARADFMSVTVHRFGNLHRKLTRRHEH